MHFLKKYAMAFSIAAASFLLGKDLEQEKVPLEEHATVIKSEAKTTQRKADPYYTTPYVSNDLYERKVTWKDGKPIG